MKTRELLILTRRLWPHCGLTEQSLLDLAENLRQAGHAVTLATIQASKEWSDRISLNGMNLVRFSRPVFGPWSSLRYARSLGRCFASSHFDGIIASGVGEIAAAATRFANKGTAVLIYVDESYEGVTGNLHRRHVETCQAADAVVANSDPVARRLRAVDGMPEIQVIEPGIRPAAFPLDDARLQIRAAFSKAHGVLRIDPNQRLVVTASRMNDDSQLHDLITAWSMVARQFPSARLWLLGDGNQSHRVWQRILELDMANQILMPGFFDDWNDIWLAADLYVHVGGATQTGDGLVRALIGGLPAVSVDYPWTRELFLPSEQKRLVPPGDTNQLAHALVAALSNRDRLLGAGRRIHPAIADRFCPQLQADRYLHTIGQSTGIVAEGVT
jgi:glycosyltransferase involved in cell wall biosynthesis